MSKPVKAKRSAPAVSDADKKALAEQRAKLQAEAERVFAEARSLFNRVKPPHLAVNGTFEQAREFKKMHKLAARRACGCDDKTNTTVLEKRVNFWRGWIRQYKAFDRGAA